MECCHGSGCDRFEWWYYRALSPVHCMVTFVYMIRSFAEAEALTLYIRIRFHCLKSVGPQLDRACTCHCPSCQASDTGTLRWRDAMPSALSPIPLQSYELKERKFNPSASRRIEACCMLGMQTAVSPSGLWKACAP